MRLLEIASTGRFRSGPEIPDEMRPALRDAALHIISATMLAPFVGWKPIKFPIERVIDPSSDAVLTEEIRISRHGIFNGKLEWLGRMRDGFKIIADVATRLDRETSSQAARGLFDILIRLNLMLSVVEAIRNSEDLQLAASLLADQIETCLRVFSDFCVISPELLGHAVAANKIKKRAIPKDADAWESVAEAAFEAWDQAEPFAARARYANTFSELLESTLACFPHYSGAVQLFLDAMHRYRQVSKEPPTELLRDFRVVEEYRVGALELLSYLGGHLVGRVGLFFHRSGGLPILDSVRKALNAARAEISVYPDVMRELWLKVAGAAASTTLTSAEAIIEFSFELQNRVRHRMPSVFRDPEVVRAALNIEANYSGGTCLNLHPGWEDDLFDVSAPLITPGDVTYNTKTSTIATKPVQGETLVFRLLGDRNSPSWTA